MIQRTIGTLAGVLRRRPFRVVLCATITASVWHVGVRCLSRVIELDARQESASSPIAVTTSHVTGTPGFCIASASSEDCSPGTIMIAFLTRTNGVFEVAKCARQVPFELEVQKAGNGVVWRGDYARADGAPRTMWRATITLAGRKREVVALPLRGLRLENGQRYGICLRFLPNDTAELEKPISAILFRVDEMAWLRRGVPRVTLLIVAAAAAAGITATWHVLRKPG